MCQPVQAQLSYSALSRKRTACLFGQAALTVVSLYDISVYSRIDIVTPGFRYPLDPALIRHAEINRSAFMTDGINVP